MAHTVTVCSQCGLEYEGGEVFCPNDGARLVARQDSEARSSARGTDSDPLLGQILGGRYRIIRKIGEGGMGIVYEAEHIVIEKRVGLKVLREDFSSRPDVVERFRQEAKSASKIGHEHIIDISDFGVTPQGAHYFVMELLTGNDLAEELEKKGPLSPRRAIHLALQCARALGVAHSKGIVHRDMKPENIFLVKRDSGEDFIKIVDFGIAKMSDIETEGQPGRKLTKTGMIFGTPEYMSPEQAGGKKLDHRVDIYAMGIIMYELLTGRVPFVGDTFMGILTQHMFETVPPISVSNPTAQAGPELERVIYKALAKNADERYQTMDELAQDLNAVLARTPSSPASLAPPPGTFTHHGYAEQVAAESKSPRLLAATDTDLGEDERKKPAIGLWVGVAVASLLLGGGGLYAMRGGEEPGSVAPTAGASVAPPPPAVTPPIAQVTNVAAAATETPRVVVRVDTEPAGAIVLVNGAEACSGTPCSFTTERGKEVTVEAEKAGYKNGKTVVIPNTETSQVTLTLRRKESAGARRDPSPSELKIPDAFGPR